MSIELQGYLINWRADLLKAAERKRLQGMEALGEAKTIEADIDELDRAIAALSPGALTEDERAVREVNAYVGGVADGYQQAVLALSPAPSEGEAQLPTMDDIIDPDFTGGLKTEEYLARLHAGTLEPADTITIAASEQHAEESACAQDLAPLFPPEPPPAATPESLEATGVVDSEWSWLARKLAKEPA